MGNCYSCEHFDSHGCICDLGIYGEDTWNCEHHKFFGDDEEEW